MDKLQTQDRKIVMGLRPASVNNTFDIFYSTDGINFYKALINSRVTLPSSGSSAVVNIPIDSNRIKLVNVANPTESAIESLTPEGPPGLVPWTDGFFYSYMTPYNAITGTIVWNENPAQGGPVGWICLGGTRWAKFGIIE